MTTTLRPTGPERHAEDGSRSRSYDICVNGRPVGSVRLTADGRPGPLSTGRLEDLAVREPDRRRGRATVAALAAEEVLRGWGCRRAEVRIPAGAEPALRLAAALGYAERNRYLAKELPPSPAGVPEAPEGSAVRPLERGEYPAWLESRTASYARHWTGRGLSAAEARRRSEESHAALLPHGPDTPRTALRALVRDGAVVGTLWLALEAPHGPGGWVYDVEVEAEHRGRGHGRTLLLDAERVCLAAGVRVLGLNVVADDTPARRLYESLGYRPTAHHLDKTLL
ncbi:GNAT family N-acetyltransferase [Streptomyces sp. URMC 125]|uniref:GNAT family N-acetyltransferase n=1 Tax=Streptomyces sp. URMC 125 TaxID=3423419 RepID=UPI003F1C0C6C